MSDEMAELIREAVWSVLVETGGLELHELRTALVECKERLEQTLESMRECQQIAEVWRTVAMAHKRESALLREKYEECGE